jgi:nucleotide-binding universal stress UspA family protein
MYDRILVPLKGDSSDEQVVAHAAALARLSGGTVTFVRVNHVHSRDEAAFLEQGARAYLDTQIARLTGQGLAADGRVEQGEPAPSIVAAAKDLNADLIVMATHGHREMRHVLVGSVTEDVLRSSLAPVLLVRP